MIPIMTICHAKILLSEARDLIMYHQQINIQMLIPVIRMAHRAMDMDHIVMVLSMDQ